MGDKTTESRGAELARETETETGRETETWSGRKKKRQRGRDVDFACSQVRCLSVQGVTDFIPLSLSFTAAINTCPAFSVPVVAGLYSLGPGPISHLQDRGGCKLFMN